jgi:hypothetical protein
VDLNPFVAPQAISGAEHGSSAAEISTVDEYNGASGIRYGYARTAV